MSPGSSLVDAGDTRAPKRQPGSSADGDKLVDGHPPDACPWNHDCKNLPSLEVPEGCSASVGSVEKPQGPGAIEIVHEIHVRVGTDSGEKDHTQTSQCFRLRGHDSREKEALGPPVTPWLTQTTEAEFGPHQIASPGRLHWLNSMWAYRSP